MEGGTSIASGRGGQKASSWAAGCGNKLLLTLRLDPPDASIRREQESATESPIPEQACSREQTPVGPHLRGIFRISLFNRTRRWCVGLKVDDTEEPFRHADQIDVPNQELTALPGRRDGILYL